MIELNNKTEVNMKKYGVRLYFDTYLYQEVEAESEEDAIEAAKDNVYSDKIDCMALAENAEMTHDDPDVWEVCN